MLLSSSQKPSLIQDKFTQTYVIAFVSITRLQISIPFLQKLLRLIVNKENRFVLADFSWWQHFLCRAIKAKCLTRKSKEQREREREHMCEIWTRYCNDLRGLEEHCITKHTRHDDDEMNLRKNRVTLQKQLVELAMIAKLRSH